MECFQPKVSTSMYYAIKDLVVIAIVFSVFFYLDGLTTSKTLRLALILLYWAVQGTLFTAVFVIGHDCGHGSFSDHSLLNDIVGTVMHGFILCPYYMWKLSHRQHHRNNANFDRDEVFYPVKETEQCATGKTLPGFGLGVGWFGYLLKGYNPRPVNHYNPFESMFAGHLVGFSFSMAALGVMSWGLYRFYSWYGFMAVLCFYFVPLFIFACYMVIITFLHHNEMNIPWYADGKWEFVRGQLSTVDRHYGFVHSIIHNIGTHQMHHMFTKIPHYRLELATTAFRKAFPDLVRVCDEPIMPSYVRMFRKYEEQSVMSEKTEIHYYQ